MHRAGFGLLLTALVLVAGCGKDNDGLTPVAGTVFVDDAAAQGAVVTFFPTGNTPGNGGTGQTDATGKYEISTPQGKKGLPPGEYKVSVSYRRNPDGSAPDPNVPPIESKAVELLPPKYSDREKTELTATVTAETKPHDFKVVTVKKK